MESALTTPTVYTGTRPTTASWVGAVITTLVALFLVFDFGIKFTTNDAVVTAFAELGYPMSLASAIATLEAFCLLVYLVPRTSILGALLLTGYLGGAIASHVRIGSPLFSHVLFPIYVALMIWGGLILRDDDLRAFVRRRIRE
jgi:DoxX-like family